MAQTSLDEEEARFALALASGEITGDVNIRPPKTERASPARRRKASA